LTAYRTATGGEHQRVGIARALLTSPRLLPVRRTVGFLDLKRKQGTALIWNACMQLQTPIIYASVTHPMKWRAWPIIWCC
jgi:ABC-type molybdate transport system ATPase subunit